MTTGLVMNISRFCTDDGPGIRTTVFLKGCPLKCIWCHNPESQGAALEIMYNSSKCILCGQCAKVCEKGCHVLNGKHLFERNNCIQCQKCVSACPSEALSIVGKVLSVDEVYLELAKDKQFYDASGGGITVSGGEPFMQAEFLLELLKACKKQEIHTAVDTCGFYLNNTVKDVLDYTDLVMLDVKHTDAEMFETITKQSFSHTIEFLDYMKEIQKPLWIRQVILPGYTDSKEQIENLLKFIQGASVEKIELLPYHRLGVSKWEELGIKYEISDILPPTDDVMKDLRQIIKDNGIKTN